MAFRITANLGDEKSYFDFVPCIPGNAHVEIVIDDKQTDRCHASHLLRGMADRLLECDRPTGPELSLSCRVGDKMGGNE